jgi:hypothetical protein
MGRLDLAAFLLFVAFTLERRHLRLGQQLAFFGCLLLRHGC